MENPFRNIMGAAAAASLAACSPAEEAPKDPFANTTEVSVSNGVPTETVTLPVEKTAEQIAEEKEKERIAELTNNGQYTVEQAEQILSGTTRELE